jgi:hypothetical protein
MLDYSSFEELAKRDLKEEALGPVIRANSIRKPSSARGRRAARRPSGRERMGNAFMCMKMPGLYACRMVGTFTIKARSKMSPSVNRRKRRYARAQSVTAT